MVDRLICPDCGAEYEDGILTCSDCAIRLVVPGGPAQIRTRHLGRFALPVGTRVLELLRAKGIDYDFEKPEDDEYAIRVDAAWRDDVASQLYSGWPQFLHGLGREAMADLMGMGGTHPGWLDAPTEIWTDRTGRLQVEVDKDDPDSGRALGPALMISGLALLLLGLVGAIDSALGVTFGLVLGILGALLPR